MQLATVLAFHLVVLHGVDGRVIEINPQGVVSLRQPHAHESKGHFPIGTQCLIFTTDGKFTPVIESCAEVNRLLGNGQQ